MKRDEHRFPRLLAMVVGSICLASVARADSLWVGASGKGVELAGVRVLRVEGGRVYFRLGGNESSRELGQVLRMQIDDEPALSAAEEAFVGEDYNKATDEYLRAQRSTTKAWLRPWIATRLTTAAGRAGRFDAAVVAYIDLLQADAALARENRPVLDGGAPPKSGQLDAAVGELDRAIARPGVGAAQRQALLQLLVEVHRARGDTARAAKTLEQLVALTPGSQGAGGGGGPAGQAGADADNQRALADLRLGQALVALDAKDYAKAASTIDAIRPALTEPRQQAEALFVLAQVRHAEARAAKDPKKLQDAAVAYMRVVAHFSDVPSAQARVPQAMFSTAEILTELGQPAEAKALYTDLLDRPTTPPAIREQARSRLR